MRDRYYLPTENKQLDYSTILSQLEDALKKEEFEIYYQPFFGMETKEIGMEALIRWNHPHMGLLSPAAFLEVAEQTGLSSNWRNGLYIVQFVKRQSFVNKE